MSDNNEPTLINEDQAPAPVDPAPSDVSALPTESEAPVTVAAPLDTPSTEPTPVAQAESQAEPGLVQPPPADDQTPDVSKAMNEPGKKPPKAPNSNTVTLAIVATVLVVVAIAILIVYGYLKTK